MPGNAKIFVFGEGQTDKVVFDFLKEKFFSQSASQFEPFVIVGGKNAFRSRILERVQPDVESKRQNISILAFRDRDAGEKLQSICQSFEDIVCNLLASWSTSSPSRQDLSEYIGKWEVSPNLPKHPGFRFVLHVANHPRLSLSVTLHNHTTDGYVLASGLLDSVLKRFAQEVGFETNVSDPQAVLETLITQSIPTTIHSKGVRFNEDKDFLAAYLVATRFWVVKRTEEQARLVRIILDRAIRYAPEDVEQVFASWIQAIREVLP